MQVEWDRHSLSVDGRRRLIRAGALHYFRLPSADLWRDRIARMRDAGLNAVDVYYPWSYHSEAPGEYDFGGIRDVDALHAMIEEAGLFLIARPGPYVCAELDRGGLPGWLLHDLRVVPRCRSEFGFTYSPEYMERVREWFAQIVPRFARLGNLLLVQIENEFAVPSPLGWLNHDLVELWIRRFGLASALRFLGSRRVRRRARRLDRAALARGGSAGQTSPYMRELNRMARELGVRVPLFHNDVLLFAGRQTDVDLAALDRYPITAVHWDWRDDPETFLDFELDEAAQDTFRPDGPVYYAELQGGWYDGWGGPGYERVRTRLGPESIDCATKAALAQRATLWSYYVFCGGVTWGYMGSPDVYTSYDYAAPVGESGATGDRYEAVRRLNGFLERFEAELVATERVQGERPWCPEHQLTRQGPTQRFVFLRNPSRTRRPVPTREGERAVLEPWETQVRVYGPGRKLVAVSPEPVRPAVPAPGLPPVLPRLERWTLADASPQLDAGYDDASWTEIPTEALERGEADLDALGLHYGFVWYRGVFQGTLDRLVLDARHCWSVWINRELVAAGDQLRNPLGIGPDGARARRISLRRARFETGRNSVVILVESLGYNKGFADDLRNPRGIVRLETGSAQVAWRFRGGLLRGERGMNPVLAFESVERSGSREVVLPHGWEGEPHGVGLYETRFRLEGVDPEKTALGLCFDPGRGKANLYLNGYLMGRYWPERGPQRRFLLPWGVLDPSEENHLAVAVWKRSARASLGRLRLEPAS